MTPLLSKSSLRQTSKLFFVIKTNTAVFSNVLEIMISVSYNLIFWVENKLDPDILNE